MAICKSVAMLSSPRRYRSSEHSEKRWFDIKNSDRNGPEGQFRMTGSAMCNAGLSTWYPCFMIQVHPIKVSMKKKRRELDQDCGKKNKNL